jgi:hypothetical protein
MYSFIIFESVPIGQKCHDTDGQDPTISQHKVATRIGLASISHCQKFAHVFLFLKSSNAHIGCVPKTTKVLMVVALERTLKHNEKG